MQGDDASMYDKEDNTGKSAYKGSRDREDSLVKMSNRYSSSSYLKATQSTKVQAIIKITSGGIGKASVARLLDYVVREISDKDKEILLSEVEDKDVGIDIDGAGDGVYLEDENGDILSNKKERNELLNEWVRDFKGGASMKKQEWKLEQFVLLKKEKKRLDIRKEIQGLSQAEEENYKKICQSIKDKKVELNGKEYNIEIKAQKDTTHVILSVGGRHDEKGTVKATEAMREFLHKNFAEAGYRYVFAAHKDTDNLHYHVILKNSHEMGGKNLRIDKADLFVLRQDLSNELTRNGIERTATLRMDREQTIEKIHKGVEQVRERHSWYQAQLAKGGEASFDVATYRNMCLKKTQYLIKGIAHELEKPGSTGDRKGLKADLKALNGFKKSLTQINPKDFNIEKEALLRNLSKENIVLVKKIDGLEEPKDFRVRGVVSHRKLNHKIYFQEYVKKHQKKLEIALQYMKEHKHIAPEQKVRNIEIINSIKTLREAAISRGKEMGR